MTDKLTDARFTYLSLGAGVQSTALLAMVTHPSAAKELLHWQEYGHDVPHYPERPDVAVFADTQAEPRYVYEHLDRLRSLTDIPIHLVTAGDLGRDSIGGGFMRLPAFTSAPDGNGAAITRRQCTREYKIAPIQKWVREHLGYAKGQRVKHKVRCMVGISVDEIQRAKPSQDKWIERVHPLIDANMRRADCIRFLEAVGWPVPKKSACTFCPYHDDATWRDLRDNYPADFAAAVAVDHGIRNSTKAGIKRPAFVHRSLVPLDQVVFREAHSTPLFDSFSEECEGLCGV